ncbi:hypothetical protein LCGC14_1129790 [marine sediment metagenome]|uniref:Uncharacterized protein n=1 Tax=marine sediment metagenome TaxID=412755 RepID=A0A0F9M1B6_9ZZZZ
MKFPPLTQEPIQHVDCTPDAGYPLRILKAHRENYECRWECDGEMSDGTKEMIAAINEGCAMRATLLDKAIAILEREGR